MRARLWGRGRLQLRIVVAALRASGSRALLALSAVGLGVAATTLTLAISAGAERELDAISAQVGRNLLQVTAGQLLSRRSVDGRGRGWYISDRLDRDDVDLLAARVADLAAIAPVLEGNRRAVLGREALSTSVRALRISTGTWLPFWRRASHTA